MKKGLSLSLKIILVYWLILFLSGKAVFVYRSGPQILPGNEHGILTCTYMAWSGLMSRDYWYSADGSTGMRVCPNMQDVDNLKVGTT